MNFDRMEEMSHQIIGLQRRVLKILSLEIFNDHSVMLLLGSMRAEERLATFLISLVRRLHARGFSPTALVLRMTREEIGSYLGMKLETVSRTFSKLSDEGIVEVNQRQVRILNPEALKRLANSKD
jgi:CRP/FNR family transcriptional regulator